MRRVVVKIGSSSLTDAAGRIEPPKLWAIARACLSLNAEVTLVSSGAVAAGRGVLGAGKPATLPHKQALAAIGQAVLMQEWARAFAPKPVAQILLSADDVQARGRFVNAKHALERVLKLGAVPIVNENDTVATAELRVGDNDTLSAWVAYLAEADTLLLLTDVDGLYTANPKSDSTARRIDVVHDVSDVEHLASGSGSALGTGGMTTKLRAARIASEAGVETVILGGGGAGLEAWSKGENPGTRVLPRRQTAKRGWLLHATPRGTLIIDAGAERALKSGKSLLPSGIMRVDGDFSFGDVVRIDGPSGPLAQGLTNYAAKDVERISGRQSAEIVGLLGHHDFDEVVHRNGLVLLARVH
ncbi:glutamate 5-kinase [Deinococcus yavapaiensis]|uniref:Glutamate 5-kinase n=1 Tax=Deinococcus yavapaiensis KR-236 TaxID=694435 RepID=A0A318SEI6_9DEIO|nr:glutamate 5-kinase [Deinococcus yavapaiensis]PYE55968.1 glutamate 5-kinase [Deinococcus yavapaiensis KR-236]